MQDIRHCASFTEKLFLTGDLTSFDIMPLLVVVHNTHNLISIQLVLYLKH